jgi:hypothetical protein
LIGGQGNNLRDISVDAAGNVVSVNSASEALRVHTPPDGPNSFLTYSPWAIQVGSSPAIIPTPVKPTTDVEETESSIPLHYSLEQNYPNPFNPGTIIQYSLPIESNVELVVYDIQGREVVKLVDERQSAGRHGAVWNGKDRAGKPVASGVYFYTMTARSSERVTTPFTQTNRMVLVR